MKQSEPLRLQSPRSAFADYAHTPIRRHGALVLRLRRAAESVVDSSFRVSEARGQPSKFSSIPFSAPCFTAGSPASQRVCNGEGAHLQSAICTDASVPSKQANGLRDRQILMSNKSETGEFITFFDNPWNRWLILPLVFLSKMLRQPF
jgi:hypothetical protein